MTDVDVTVIIPTYNGDRYLAEVLDAIASQDYPGAVEVLVIDSGSTDRTLDIVRARSGVRLHQIPNAEFGHGRTRNLGARLARGRFLAYLTQDATPAHPAWLRELIAPLDPDGVDAVAVVGRQAARQHCFPAMKYDIADTFAAVGPEDRVSVFHRDPSRRGVDGDDMSFYSDVNSATRRDFLLDVIPYRDLSYSEDVAFARDLIRAGYRKAYAPAALVIHSNDVTVRGYRNRMVEETVGLRRAGQQVPRLSGVGAFLRAARDSLRTGVRIVRDVDYGFGKTLYWLAVNPCYLFARWRGIARGSSFR